MSSVVKAVNRAFDRVETRPFWKVRLISLLLVGLSALTAAATIVLIIFGAPLGAAISRKAHLGGVWDAVWTIARWPVAFAAVLLLFSFIYQLAPNVDSRRWRWITPGSLLGALLWLALSGLFALYVKYAGSYTKTYGTLASGVILLLWLNYTAMAILFGAELNAQLDRQAHIRAARRSGRP
jgi:membrane protein